MSKLNPDNELMSAENEAEILAQFGGKVSFRPSGEGTERSMQIEITGPADRRFNDALKLLFRAEKQVDLLYESSLLNLVSTTEWFFSRLLHLYYDQYPEAVGGQDKVYSLNDLRDLGSIDEARKLLIETKIEDVMRKSFEEWIVFLKDRVKLSMGYADPDRDSVIEIYQRGNLIVHNGGIVNSIYMSKVPEAARQGVSPKDELKVDREYLDLSINSLEKLFILIALEFWKKLKADDTSRARLVLDIGFEHLKSERWSVAESIYYFLMNDAKMNEMERLLGTINYWQCRKWQGASEEVKAKVEQLDFSAKDPLLQLGRYCLIDDYKNCLRLLPGLISSGRLDNTALVEWPIFRELRKQEGVAEFLPECKNDVAD